MHFINFNFTKLPRGKEDPILTEVLLGLHHNIRRAALGSNRRIVWSTIPCDAGTTPGDHEKQGMKTLPTLASDPNILCVYVVSVLMAIITSGRNEFHSVILVPLKKSSLLKYALQRWHRRVERVIISSPVT